MKNNPFFYTLKVYDSQKNLLLNTLNRAKISVFNLKIEGNVVAFSIKVKDMRKTFAILKNMCYNYKVCDKRTPKTLVLEVLKRVGFVTSFFLSLISVYFCSHLIVGVRILVDDVAIREQISSLKQISNFSPCFSGDVDLKLLRENVCSISSVAECSIKVKGNYLEVSILPSPKEESRNPIYSSYVSKYDENLLTTTKSTFGLASSGKTIPAYDGDVTLTGVDGVYFKINNGDYVCTYAGDDKFYIYSKFFNFSLDYSTFPKYTNTKGVAINTVGG